MSYRKNAIKMQQQDARFRELTCGGPSGALPHCYTDEPLCASFSQPSTCAWASHSLLLTPRFSLCNCSLCFPTCHQFFSSSPKALPSAYKHTALIFGPHVTLLLPLFPAPFTAKLKGCLCSWYPPSLFPLSLNPLPSDFCTCRSSARNLPISFLNIWAPVVSLPLFQALKDSREHKGQNLSVLKFTFSGRKRNDILYFTYLSGEDKELQRKLRQKRKKTRHLEGELQF